MRKHRASRRHVLGRVSADQAHLRRRLPTVGRTESRTGRRRRRRYPDPVRRGGTNRCGGRPVDGGICFRHGRFGAVIAVDSISTRSNSIGTRSSNSSRSRSSNGTGSSTIIASPPIGRGPAVAATVIFATVGAVGAAATTVAGTGPGRNMYCGCRPRAAVSVRAVRDPNRA